MKTLVIGDIHGRYYEMQALLDKARVTDTDSIISESPFLILASAMAEFQK